MTQFDSLCVCSLEWAFELGLSVCHEFQFLPIYVHIPFLVLINLERERLPASCCLRSALVCHFSLRQLDFQLSCFFSCSNQSVVSWGWLGGSWYACQCLDIGRENDCKISRFLLFLAFCFFFFVLHFYDILKATLRVVHPMHLNFKKGLHNREGDDLQCGLGKKNK